MQAILFNFMAIGFIFNSNIYVSTVVRYSELRIRYGYSVMGVRPACFWAGSFLHDLGLFGLGWAGFVGGVGGVGVGFLVGRLAVISALVGVFIVALLLFCYCWSFAFSQSKSVFSWFTTINFLLFYGLQFIYCFAISDVS
jgi:hypothetical protein